MTRWWAAAALLLSQTACLGQLDLGGAWWPNQGPLPDRGLFPNQGLFPRRTTVFDPTLQARIPFTTVADPLPVLVPVWHDPAIEANAPLNARLAYHYLLDQPSLTLAARCGADDETKVWTALANIVRSNEVAILQDIAERAATREARAAALIGMLKLRVVSTKQAHEQLASFQNPLEMCNAEGMRVMVAPWHAASLFTVPLPDAQ